MFSPKCAVHLEPSSAQHVFGLTDVTPWQISEDGQVIPFRQSKLLVIRNNVPFNEKEVLCNWSPSNVLSNNYIFNMVIVKLKHTPSVKPQTS